jgi:acid phosphatase
MQNVTRVKLLFACSVCFLVGWLLGHGRWTSLQADPAPQKKVDSLPFSMPARLGGNIYLQTSAEYRACCRGIYKCAELRLEAALKADPKTAKPAVVMDLDETVIDNSAFQTFLYKNNL